MRDLFNSQNGIWEERLKKEVAARASWNILYGHKYLKEGFRTRLQPQQACSGSVLKVGPVPTTGSPVRKEAKTGWPESREVRGQAFKTGGAQGDRVRQAPQYTAAQGRPEDLEMRRPSPATLKLLFQGISHDRQGRSLYLKERYQLKPEEKYKYPMVSSWEYGWHVGDAMKDYRTLAHARMQPITKTFYMKNGVFHIPRRSDALM